MKSKVIFIGAGPGDPDLITVKGRKVIEKADVIIYAGSLVNKDVLAPRKEECDVHNSAYLNLEETIDIMKKAIDEDKLVARVHTGDPAIYGAIGEQIRELKKLNIEYEIIDHESKGILGIFSKEAKIKVRFKDTIENNVRYGKADATDEEVEAALEFANCYSFINKLPMGKNTLLTEGATNISLGQRQLITIARAVLANPKILILDEATSSVDTRTEKNIQDAMVKLMKDRTSIIIAHRLSTIKDADLIVVLDKGMVIEMGNHAELIEQKGQYYKLYQTQFKGMET